MNQTFDALFQFHKCAELGHAGDRPSHPAAGHVLLARQVPRVRLELFHAERNAPLRRIHFQNLGLDLLIHRQRVTRFIHAAPGNVGHVQQSVHPANIHESAVIGEAAHRALHGFAHLDFGVAAFFGFALFIFQNGAAIHHHVFIRHVQFDDAAADLLADQLLHLRRIARAAARCRHEGAHAQIHAQAAFNQ